MKCKTCGSFDFNHTQSGSICTNCGELNEEEFITTSLNFTETNGISTLNGEMIRMTDTYSKVGGNIIRSTNFQIQNQIKTICSSIGLSEEIALTAFRWYKLSLQANLTRGRSILYTLSACIYIVCRQEKTPHLIADFAHFYDLDVFKIGQIFMKIVIFLNVKVPLIDPSLFLNRYYQRLEFKNKEILSFSMRLIQRMKRDWIVTGRRPNNLCGAALVTASRVFGEERSVNEVARVVCVSPVVINLRLSEMKDTQSAMLSVNEFCSVWLEKEEDPPVVKKRGCFKMQTGILTPPSESLFCETESLKENFNSNEISNLNEHSTNESSNENSTSKDSQFIFDNDFLEQSYNSDDSIDSSEIENFILTNEESQAKESIWNGMFDEFLKEKAQRQPVKKKEKKRKAKVVYESVEDALKDVLKDKRISNKINYEALKDLFGD